MALAQSPEAHTRLERGQRLTLLVSSGPESRRIMPQLVGLAADEVESLLTDYGITVTRHAEPYSVRRHGHYQPWTITAQQPLAGSWVDLHKPLTVHLAVLTA